MKICFLCYRANPYSGGQGVYLKYVAAGMSELGHEVHAIVGPPYPGSIDGVHMHYLDNNQYHIKRGFGFINNKKPFDIFQPLNFYEWFSSRLGSFPEISSFGFRAFTLLRQLQEKHGFDIIHDNQSLGYGLLVMKAFGIPVVASIHHPLTIDLEIYVSRAETFYKKFRTVMFYPTLMQSMVSKRLDHIVTGSEDSKTRIISDYGIAAESLTVIYDGIDRRVFRPLKLRREPRTLLFVGNVEDGKKGFVYLLKAVAESGPDIRLVVVDGGSPHRRISESLIRKLGISDRVFFKGAVSTGSLVRLYSESTIAVVPSMYEGFGFPAAEAMACGIPVISSDAGSLPEVVGDAGIIVPAGDYRALADAINSVISNKKMQRQLACAGLERVTRLFNWDKACKSLEELYSELY